MIFLYYIYLASYVVFSSYCYYKDVLSIDDAVKSTSNKIKYKKALPLVTINLTLVSYPVFSTILKYYQPQEFHLVQSIFHIITAKYMSQLLFYCSHRTFHRVPQLKKYHKVHHNFQHPIGMRAAYTHPVDFIFGNMIPLGIMPFILQVNIYTMILIIIYGIYDTIVNEHSDYNKSDHHLKHHIYFNYNFGETRLDKFFGTYKE